MWPLLGATFVAIMAFGALGLSQDSTGEYCRSLFQVITYSLLLSWVLAVTDDAAPVCEVPQGREDCRRATIPTAARSFAATSAFLSACIKARWLTVAAAVLFCSWRWP